MAVTEYDALRRLEQRARATLAWQWEDGADEDCVKDMTALREALDDLDALRRLMDDTKGKYAHVGEAGRLGGLARAANLSAEERSEIARQGGIAKGRKKK